ncbi:MAG: aminotransferase class V-fold PLP-dependent enzyme [Bacteroidota bacterium]
MLDIDKARLDTPSAGDRLFFNSAGSSLPPLPVVKIVEDYWLEESKVGGYAYAEEMKGEIEGFYTAVANLLNARSRNIAMAVSATDAYIRALSAIPFQTGDVILTTDDDYVSNHIHFLSLQKRFGVKIERGRTLENGDLDLEHFEAQITQHQPVVVAATHIPTNSGLVQDVVGLGAICRAYDRLYLVDACQSAGQLPLDVAQIQCDFLSATGRKFLRGPRATGFLYVSDRALDMGLEPLFPDLQGADWTEPDAYQIQPTARRFELWEWQYATMLGLREAVSYALNIGMENIWEYNHLLLTRLTDGLSHIKGVRQLDRGSHRANIVTLQKINRSQEETITFLKKNNVFFSVAALNSAQIDFGKKGVNWAIRLSPHYFNTSHEIDRLLEIVESM